MTVKICQAQMKVQPLAFPASCQNQCCQGPNESRTIKSQMTTPASLQLLFTFHTHNPNRKRTEERREKTDCLMKLQRDENQKNCPFEILQSKFRFYFNCSQESSSGSSSIVQGSGAAQGQTDNCLLCINVQRNGFTGIRSLCGSWE